MSRKRVVVAGLGDVGVLAAIRLAKHFDVVGISVKPGLVSGQELGVRLARPRDWARDYWIPFDRFRRLDRVRIIQGALTGVDLAARTVSGHGEDGTPFAEGYDALVISTGVSNGFWRRPTLQSAADVGADLHAAHDRLAAATSVIVVGGGAAAVTSAVNLATTWPDKRIDLYFPGDRALGDYHPRIWQRIQRRLAGLGVGLHPGHRAALTNGFAGDEITTGGVDWSTGQPAASADAVLWAIGRVQPNTDWLPRELLDDGGFVRVTPELRTPATRTYSRPVMWRPPTRCAVLPAIVATRWSRATSAPRWPAAVRGLIGHPAAGGARSWASSPTGWRSSCPPARRSAYRRGPSNGW